MKGGRYWDEGVTLVEGCTPCSKGCAHCWSAAMAHRFAGKVGHPRALTTSKGQFNGRTVSQWLRLDRLTVGHTGRVMAIWNDLFHRDVSDRFIEYAFRAMLKGPHTCLVLTKRAERMGAYCSALLPRDWTEQYADKLWLGASICTADEIEPARAALAQLSAAGWRTFVSFEPLLEGLDVTRLVPPPPTKACEGCWRAPWDKCRQPCERYSELGKAYDAGPHVGQVIVGGETGPGARPMKPEWVRAIRDACAAGGVPFYFKGWGEWAAADNVGEHVTNSRGHKYDRRELRVAGHERHPYERDLAWQGQVGLPPLVRIGRKAAGRMLDGRTHDELAWRAGA